MFLKYPSALTENMLRVLVARDFAFGVWRQVSQYMRPICRHSLITALLVRSQINLHSIQAAR
jgi:hypothetical protein